MNNKIIDFYNYKFNIKISTLLLIVFLNLIFIRKKKKIFIFWRKGNYFNKLIISQINPNPSELLIARSNFFLNFSFVTYSGIIK